MQSGGFSFFDPQFSSDLPSLWYRSRESQDPGADLRCRSYNVIRIRSVAGRGLDSERSPGARHQKRRAFPAQGFERRSRAEFFSSPIQLRSDRPQFRARCRVAVTRESHS